MYKFKAGDRVQLKQGVLDGYPHLKQYYNKVYVVSKDKYLFCNSVLKAYVDAHGGYLPATGEFFEYSNPIWIKNN